ncbi:hypothetical protein OQ486_09765 [Plesiomonas shigelloides]|uniref:hypothetical protein n=1 Tax=Plesiomonas shigelloides TaxID=703 RepID=UPI002247C36F|nr:hypothetical protein [Plesiomonas shigelloides]MCX2533763.1 hypothetical protein [Plesiomonas shigelloides]
MFILFFVCVMAALSPDSHFCLRIFFGPAFAGLFVACLSTAHLRQQFVVKLQLAHTYFSMKNQIVLLRVLLHKRRTSAEQA